MEGFKTEPDWTPVSREETRLLVRKMLDGDFFVYFNGAAVDRYLCSTDEDKAEVVYDLLKDGGTYSPDGRLIYLKSNIGDYGVYAMEDLLSESERYADKEEI